jgi:hypothetical protein
VAGGTAAPPLRLVDSIDGMMFQEGTITELESYLIRIFVSNSERLRCKRSIYYCLSF